MERPARPSPSRALMEVVFEVSPTRRAAQKSPPPIDIIKEPKGDTDAGNDDEAAHIFLRQMPGDMSGNGTTCNCASKDGEARLPGDGVFLDEIYHGDHGYAAGNNQLETGHGANVAHARQCQIRQTDDPKSGIKKPAINAYDQQEGRKKEGADYRGMAMMFGVMPDPLINLAAKDKQHGCK